MDIINTEKSKNIKLQIKFNWKLQPILADEFIQLPSLEKSFIGILKNKQSISEVIISLNNILPIPKYLKRCSGSQIYLTSINSVNGNEEDLKKLLIQKGFDISLLEDNFQIADIPSVRSQTKTQMAYASQFWSINFHPNPYLESIISGSVFDNEQLISLEAYMKLAISIAETKAVGSKNCNGSALIVNPENGNILSMAASSIDKHPMWHASMIAIDLIARMQGGGTWKLVTNLKKYSMSNYNEIPVFYPECLNDINIYIHENWLLKNNLEINKNIDKKSESYLCTGYWAILLQEPCPVCAMALLHSRVSKIFYGVANPQTGILGSRAILHSMPGLNHRYQVWSSILVNECIATLNKCQNLECLN